MLSAFIENPGHADHGVGAFDLLAERAGIVHIRLDQAGAPGQGHIAAPGSLARQYDAIMALRTECPDQVMTEESATADKYDSHQEYTPLFSNPAHGDAQCLASFSLTKLLLHRTNHAGGFDGLYRTGIYVRHSARYAKVIIPVKARTRGM